MATYERGDMWSIIQITDHFIITTNAVVKPNGALVMGAGIARRVRESSPGIDLACGMRVDTQRDDQWEYGLILGVDNTRLGLFQVKRHWNSPAELGLIRQSSYQLEAVAEKQPNERFDLNFPGIGLGGLPIEQVKPIIDTLPDNVHVWTY